MYFKMSVCGFHEDFFGDEQKVKTQIVDEYYANKRNKQYQESKEKFSYLHEKLSHIKRLVMDYDALHSIVEDPCDDQTVSCY